MRVAIHAAMKSDRLVSFIGRNRSTGPDAGLDRQIAAALEYQRIARLPALESMEPARARAWADEQIGAAELAPEPMAEVIDTHVGFDRIPVRIFVPRDASPHWIVWNHGGGGVIGSINSSERQTRYLAAKTGCTVASVGYRLAPENRHPAAIDDACAAFEALGARVPAGGRVAIAGDSFGGFLAAHVDHQMKLLKRRQPDLQVMIYPMVDLRLIAPSLDRYGEGYLLTKSMMHYFRSHYLNNEEEQHSGSPWFWDNLYGSAPAIIATAGFDPLVDEGDAWAQRLRDAGVTVRHHRFDSLVHGFLSLAGVVKAGRAALDEVCAEIVEMLG